MKAGRRASILQMGKSLIWSAIKTQAAMTSTPLLALDKDGLVHLAGSGTRLRIGKTVVILTAKHVVEDLQQYPQTGLYAACITRAEGLKMLPLRGMAHSDPALDLAFLRLEGDVLEEQENSPAVQLIDTTPMESPDPKDQCVALGFSESRVKSRYRAGMVDCEWNALFTNVPTDPPADLAQPDVHIALIHQREMSRRFMDWAPVTSPDPAGQSGGGIWMISDYPGSRRRITLRLAGILTDWHATRKLLVGIQIYHALTLIQRTCPDLAPTVDAFLENEQKRLSPAPLPTEARTTSVQAPGRNSPCSCGSGRKYKKCCGV